VPVGDFLGGFACSPGLVGESGSVAPGVVPVCGDLDFCVAVCASTNDEINSEKASERKKRTVPPWDE
jgi:hypothetical protein